MSRPIIGINTTYERDGDGGITAIRPPYWQAIVNAGGLPFMLPQVDSPEIIKEALERVDGFLLIGGYDIPAERFGGTTLPTAVPMESKREQTDFALIGSLIESETPTLAICLGYQELNVSRGGALYQDLIFDGPPSNIRHYSKTAETPHHMVEIASDSRLAKSLGASGELEVNSSHHQAISKLGKGLRAVAHAADGLIEAVELEGHPFFLGVQWHPERMKDSAEQKSLFRNLIEVSERMHA